MSCTASCSSPLLSLEARGGSGGAWGRLRGAVRPAAALSGTWGLRRAARALGREGPAPGLRAAGTEGGRLLALLRPRRGGGAAFEADRAQCRRWAAGSERTPALLPSSGQPSCPPTGRRMLLRFHPSFVCFNPVSFM